MKNWKVIIGVLGVFVLGMLAGGLVTARFARKSAQRAFAAGFPRAPEFAARRLDRELGLDADQHRQVLAALQEAQHQLRAVYAAARPELGRILSASSQKVRAALRPDQQEKYDRILAERRARWQKAAREFGSGQNQVGPMPGVSPARSPQP
jgi:hypothetical protein